MKEYPFTEEEFRDELNRLWKDHCKRIDYQVIADLFKLIGIKWVDSVDDPTYVPEYRDIRRTTEELFNLCKDVMMLRYEKGQLDCSEWVERIHQGLNVSVQFEYMDEGDWCLEMHISLDLCLMDINNNDGVCPRDYKLERLDFTIEQ